MYLNVVNNIELVSYGEQKYSLYCHLQNSVSKYYINSILFMFVVDILKSLNYFIIY